eukprot:969763_1
MIGSDEPRSVFNDIKLNDPMLLKDSGVKWNTCKRSLYRHTFSESNSLLNERIEVRVWVTTTDVAHTFWQELSKFAEGLTMDELLDKHIANLAHEMVQLHPDLIVDVDNAMLYKLCYERSIIDLKIKYIKARNIKTKVPRSFFSSMLLDYTSNESILFQSRYGAEIIKYKEWTWRWMIDGTFVPIWLSNKVGYSMEIFWSVRIPAPSIEYVSKIIMVGCAWTFSKKKENYIEIATKIRSANQLKYDVDFSHITELSSDMEWSLFTEFVRNLLINAHSCFCFFHTMQNWMKHLSVCHHVSHLMSHSSSF